MGTNPAFLNTLVTVSIKSARRISSRGKRSLNPLSGDYFPWKWAGMEFIDNTKRNIKKKRLLKQFKITPANKLWYDPEETLPFYGWD